jgi:sugar O-acyltransferase (sialic acid O-acetyltransferase NeuD family)
MSEVKGIIIIGAGGHAGVVLNALSGAPILGLLDDYQRPKTILHGTSVLGRIEFKRGWEEVMFHIAIGDNQSREEVFNRMGLPKERYFNCMSPVAMVPKSIRPGYGNFFGPYANIGPDCYIGDFSIVNTHASLDHDGHLSSYSHLAPGVITGGHVRIGHHTTVGMGSIIRNQITVGHNCMIGAGSLVIADVPDDSVGYGVPWKPSPVTK